MDETTNYLSLASHMLTVAAMVAAPAVLASLAIGLVVGIFQTATSINEQTLTFVPKLMVVLLVLMLFGGSMMGLLEDFLRDIFSTIAHFGQGAGTL